VVEKSSQIEPKKRSRRFYVIFAAAILTLAITVGVVIFEWSSEGQTSYGQGPVYIDEVATGKPYYFQGEEVNFTVTVNNPHDWPVGYPGSVGYLIEKDGLWILQGDLCIDYANPRPEFPAHSRTVFYESSLTWDQKMAVSDGSRGQAPPGNYTLKVYLSGPSYNPSANCTFEIRAREGAAAVEYTGVKAGDWVKYDNSISWTGSGTEPSSVTEFKQFEWQMFRIQSVIGDALLEYTIHFKNGTDQRVPLTGDYTAKGIYGSGLLFPPGLKKGDTFQSFAAPGLGTFIPGYDPSIVNVVVNDTVTRNYMGSSRSVNVLSLTVSSSRGFGSETVYWDQKTGVLLEVVLQASRPDGTVQSSMKASETNMW
jgi:hypothetical protein